MFSKNRESVLGIDRQKYYKIMEKSTVDQTSKRMLETLCRLCAVEKPVLIRIFDQDGLDKNLPEKIQLNLGITVSKDDVLPLSVCYLCLEKLEAFNSFVESCQMSQISLNELHSQYKDIADMDLKQNSSEDNVVEVVFIDSEMFETEYTMSTASLKALGNETTLQEVEAVAVKPEDCDDDSVIMMESCDEEWETISSEDEHFTASKNNHLAEMANTVFNLFRQDLEDQRNAQSKNFKQPSSDEAHEELVGIFSCPVCQTSFNRKGNLQQHLKIHSGEKPHKCDECSLTFLRRQHLIRHKRIHSGEKPYSCDICGSRFTRKTSVRRHIENHLAPPKTSAEPSAKTQQFTEIPADDVGEKQYVCNLCGASFARRNYVLQHAIVHTTARPYVCDVCSYSFARSQHLSRHMMIHMDIRPHKCDTCNSSFRRGSYLKQHMKIHSRDTENASSGDSKTDKTNGSAAEGIQCTCEICGNSFSDIKYLRQHYKTHSTEKPFECHDCGSSFRRKHHLRRHVLIHTGEKPFLCSVCGASFARKFYLKVHSVVHSSEKPYPCKICGNAFSRKSSLRQHMKTHTFVKTLT